MIYCVEDDANVRDIEVYALRSTGFEAEGVEGGAELFAALKRPRPSSSSSTSCSPERTGWRYSKSSA